MPPPWWTSPTGRRRGTVPASTPSTWPPTGPSSPFSTRPDWASSPRRSGLHRPDAEFVAVVDPVDGSTNASRGIPWYATSVCVLDAAGPRAAVVANLSTGVRYHAVRGGGAWRDTTGIGPSGCTEMRRAVVALSGYPPRHLGWAQFRALGSAALEMCAVAEGLLDAFSVGGRSHLAPWDYLGAMLLCTEAGATVVDLAGAELVTTDFTARRAVAAAATLVVDG